MKRKQRLWILLTVICAMMLMGSVSVQAKNLKNTTGVSWGLKINKDFTYRSYWGGVGMIPQKVRLSNWSDQWSSKLGYRVLTFRINFTRVRKPTVKQLVAAATFYHVKHPELDSTSPNCWYTIVDYNTGKCLEVPNSYGVTVSDSGFTHTSTTYRTSGYGITMQNAAVDVRIEYPYQYKNMCIGVGGVNSIDMKSADSRYWKGKTAFWNTKSYRSSKYKNIAYFGRWWFDP